MKSVKTAALMACYNRKAKTVQAITSIIEGNPHISFTFFVVDDHSTDGTKIALSELKENYDIQILSGSGSLFYSKSMNMAMNYVRQQKEKSFQYVLLLNDDVRFYPRTIESMIQQSRGNMNAVIAGSTVNHKKLQSYGAVKYIKGSIRYKMLSPEEHLIPADTFNGNCVLIPWQIFIQNEPMDSYYNHGMGDFDYGMTLSRSHTAIYSSKEYVGVCENNPVMGTWRDTSLSFCTRLRKKESPKGLPFRDWFHYLKKFFGLKTALWHSITPYIRILIHK